KRPKTVRRSKSFFMVLKIAPFLFQTLRYKFCYTILLHYFLLPPNHNRLFIIKLSWASLWKVEDSFLLVLFVVHVVVTHFEVDLSVFPVCPYHRVIAAVPD